MTENTENLVLEILRQMRGDMAGLRTNMRDGFNRVEVRLGFVEQALTSMFTSICHGKPCIRGNSVNLTTTGWKPEG
jgi:hypothetical protein